MSDLCVTNFVVLDVVIVIVLIYILMEMGCCKSFR